MESRHVKKFEKDVQILLLDIVCEYNLGRLLGKMSEMYSKICLFVQKNGKSQSNWDNFYIIVSTLRLNKDVVGLLIKDNKPMSEKLRILWDECSFPFNRNYGDFFIDKNSSFEDFLLYCENRKAFVDKCFEVIKQAQIRKVSDVPKHYFISRKEEVKQPKLF